MSRLLVALLLASCGSRSDAGAFEQAVVSANMEFDYCFTGMYRPREDFPYSEAAALSACRGCWLDQHSGRIPLCDEVEDACFDVLSFDRCACVWQTSWVNEEVCRGCLHEACGVDAITDESVACAKEHCERPDTCAFSADCAIR